MSGEVRRGGRSSTTHCKTSRSLFIPVDLTKIKIFYHSLQEFEMRDGRGDEEEEEEKKKKRLNEGCINKGHVRVLSFPCGI